MKDDLLKELYRGPRILYALVPGGGQPGPYEYYQALSDPTRGRYNNLFLRVCNGMQMSRDRYHKLTKPHRGKQTDLWEFKDISSKTRFLSFNDLFDDGTIREARIILTHGFQKKEDDLAPREIDQALRLQEDYYRKLQLNAKTQNKTPGRRK